MVKLILGMISFMSNYVVTAVQLSLEYLGIIFLVAVAVHNVAVMVHCVLSVSVLFSKVRQIPTKTPIHIFRVYIVSNDKFQGAVQFIF